MANDPAPNRVAPTNAATRRSYDAVAVRYAMEIAGELLGKPADQALLDQVARDAARPDTDRTDTHRTDTDRTDTDRTDTAPSGTAVPETRAGAGPGGMVADVGCGPGHVAAYLAQQGARVIGLDLSPAMCAIARAAGADPAPCAPVAAADMTALPVRSGALSALVCLYAVIHLDRDQRRGAYREFARVLAPEAQALIAFHTSAADAPSGTAVAPQQWWDEPVELIFRYLDPDEEVALLAEAGLTLLGRLDREPYPGVEHASRRSYLTVGAATPRARRR